MLIYRDPSQLSETEKEKLSDLSIEKKLEIFRSLKIPRDSLFGDLVSSYEKSIERETRSTFEYKGKSRVIALWSNVLLKLREVQDLHKASDEERRNEQRESIRRGRSSYHA